MNLKTYSILIGLTLATSITAAKVFGVKYGFITYDFMLLVVLFFSSRSEIQSDSVIDGIRDVKSHAKPINPIERKSAIAIVVVSLVLTSAWPGLFSYAIAAVFFLSSYGALLAFDRFNHLYRADKRAREMLSIFAEGGPESNKILLSEIEGTLRSPELCKAAVSRNSNNFKYVPDECKTSEIALIALKSDGKNLQYIPEDEITLDYVVAAVSQEIWLHPSPNRRGWNQSVQRVKPIGSRGDEYHDESPYKFIPEKFRNEKIARLAIHFTPQAIRYFPFNAISDTTYINAICTDGQLLLDVPFDRRNQGICLAALNAREGSEAIKIEDIPDSARDVEVWRILVARDPNELANVPDAIKTDDICFMAVSKSGATLSDVPLEHRSYHICRAAVESYGDALKWVPTHIRDRAMYEAAIKNQAKLSLVPEELRSKDICDLAVSAASYNIRHVPMALQSKTLQFKAIDSYAGSIHDIPESLIDEELCVRALKHELSTGGGTVDLDRIPNHVANSPKVRKLVSSVSAMYDQYSENIRRQDGEDRDQRIREGEEIAKAEKSQEDLWIEQNKKNMALDQEREREKKVTEEQSKLTIGHATKVHAKIRVFNIDGALMFELYVGEDAVIVGYTTESVTYYDGGLHLITYDKFQRMTNRQYRG
jgi:predicted metal-binding protein